jgi:cytochrome c-type biogenesis protein CcsB
MSIDSILFFAAGVLYVSSMFAFLIYYILESISSYKVGVWGMKAAFFLHTAAIIVRTINAKYIPLTNQYEFASCFAWGICLLFLLIDKKYSIRVMGTFISPIISIILLYAAAQPKEIRPLLPVIQNNWILMHVITAVLSYGTFASACAASIIYLICERSGRDRVIQSGFKHLHVLSVLSHRLISLGFITLTAVILSGAIWADRVWGSYWQWDPKETLSLITWIVYTVYFHMRTNRRCNNKASAWYAIVGFITVLFAYMGANTFLSGYHSY